METYLFFDIECANQFGRMSKMCSFGYVLTDTNFNILEQDDLVMNPAAKIQGRLLDPNSDCCLAYPEDYFKAQPEFPFFYDKIKSLLDAPERSIFGFAVGNDITFVTDACTRYKKPYIYFSAYDIAKLLQGAYKQIHSLGSWLDVFGVSRENITAHKSSDDALMTMLAYKKLCKDFPEQKNKFPAASRFSSEQKIQQILIERYRRYINLQILKLTEKENPSPLSMALCKEKFRVCLPGFVDAAQTMQVCLDIYNHGGILTLDFSKETNLVLAEYYKQKWVAQIEHAKIYSVNALYKRIGLRAPVLCNQGPDIPEYDSTESDNLRSISIEHIRDELETNASHDFYDEKIFEMYGCPCPTAKTDILSGKEFRIVLSKKIPLKTVYNVCRDVWENGGMLLESKKNGCIFVKDEAKAEPEWMKEAGCSLWSLSRLYEILGKPLEDSSVEPDEEPCPESL